MGNPAPPDDRLTSTPYEATDAFTRVHAREQAPPPCVRPVEVPGYDRKVLLANDRIVTALENDLDEAYVPGSLVEMLKQRASGEATDSGRFYEPIQPEYRDRDKAHHPARREQQIEKAIMYPGWVGSAGRGLPRRHRAALTTTSSPSQQVIDEDWALPTRTPSTPRR